MTTLLGSHFETAKSGFDAFIANNNSSLMDARSNLLIDRSASSSAVMASILAFSSRMASTSLRSSETNLVVSAAHLSVRADAMSKASSQIENLAKLACSGSLGKGNNKDFESEAIEKRERKEIRDSQY
jgi:hypothetical protein